MGRGPALPTRTQTCLKHGQQKHRQNLNGKGVINAWKCVACISEYDAMRQSKIADGTWVPKWGNKPEKIREICPECFTELPATNICDCGYIPKEKEA